MKKMLDADKVKLIQRYNKCWILGFLCIAFIMRVMYCKYQRNEIIFSDDFDENEDKDPLANTTKYTVLMNFFEAEQDMKEIEMIKKEKRMKFLRLKRKIKKINDGKVIYRENKDHLLTDKSAVVVIQVQTELWRLSNLLETISNAKFIRDAFIIFAHDYYDGYINEMVRTLNTSEYMQIFYPFSTQLYPSVFPGDNNRFCKGEYECEISNKRDPWLAQQKHFWWWHVNYVFENVEALTLFEGYVLFLNYEQVLSEDFVYMLKKMTGVIDTVCPECDIISLGANQPDLQRFRDLTGDILVQEFGATDYNTGIALKIATWRLIKEYKKHFCYYNDFRWDESLKFLNTKLPKRLLMLSSAGSRVISTNCEEQLESSECDSQTNLEEAMLYFRSVSRDLYPHKLQVKPTNQSKLVVKVVQGGYWEDIRDQEFCMFMVDPRFDKLQTLLEF